MSAINREEQPPHEFESFSCITIGALHERLGMPCQDYTSIVKQDAYTVAVVCDGHGGRDYMRSKKGSELCAAAATECAANAEFLEAMGNASSEAQRDRLILQLKKSIISRWNELVAEDFENNDFTSEELEICSSELAERYKTGRDTEIAYGTTLICCIITGDFILVIQIGDGTLVIVGEGDEFSKPMPEDERCFLNYTSSICTRDALDCARHYFSEKLPVAVFLASDGVDKSFADNETLYKFYSLTLGSYRENGVLRAKEELEDFLPRLSKNGVGDDISIAAIFRKA